MRRPNYAETGPLTLFFTQNLMGALDLLATTLSSARGHGVAATAGLAGNCDRGLTDKDA